MFSVASALDDSGRLSYFILHAQGVLRHLPGHTGLGGGGLEVS